MKYLPVEHRPYDFAISPDGQFALVQTGTYVPPNTVNPVYGGKLYVIDLTPTSGVYAHQVFDSPLDLTEYTSDALDTVEEYCLGLGAGAPTANVGAALKLTPSPITLLSNNVLGVDSASVLEASSGHPFAVVRNVFGGEIWNLKTGAPGPFPLPPPRYWDPVLLSERGGESLRLSDAVQSTSTHTIAISNHKLPGPYNSPPNHGFVGIASFDGQVNVTHGFTCTSVSQSQGGCPAPTSGPSRAVHDVAITPNGSMAVVSGNGLYGVFRMSTGAKIFDSWQASSLAPAVAFRCNPFNRITIDSVEVTNSRAVLIGSDGNEQNGPYQNCPTPSDLNFDVAKWAISVVNLRSSPISQVDFGDLVTPTCFPSRAHDVAITPNGNFAFVTTRVGTCRIDLTGWPASAPQFYTDQNDPLDHGSGDAFVSDSIVCTNTKAVAIGRNMVSGDAQVCIYDVNEAVGAWDHAIERITLSNPAIDGSHLLPTDVVIDPSERFAFVRSRDLNISSPSQFDLYGRISMVDLAARTLVAEFDGTAGAPFGAGWGVDQIEASSQFVISGGEYGVFSAPNGTPPGTQPPSVGWIQLISY